MIVPIDDIADPRIEPYRNIRERDLVGREGLFVAEGKVVLAMLLTSPAYRPQSLLIAAHRLDALVNLIADVPEDVPVFAAEQAVLDGVAGFPLHRGILAIGRRTDTPGADELLGRQEAQSTILFLSGISNHDNMGGIFRNAAAFGAGAILLDSDCCDPLYRKAIRVSVGAALLVPFAKLERDEDPITLLDRHGFTAIALTPSGDSVLTDLAPGPRNSVLLGTEGEGLSPELIARAKSVRIDMAPGFDSLNVATTSGIVLHHLSTARKSAFL